MSYNIIEEVEYDPGAVINVTKQIWNNETRTFVTRRYIRYYRRSQEELDRDAKMLEETYGPSKSQGMWWIDQLQKFVWLAESAATFWTLKK